MSVSEQQLRLVAELTSVAYAHAPAFVDAAQSVAAADEATNRCRDAASTLQSQLAAFRVAAQHLQESGAAWRKQRELATSAQAAMSRLTELQEAPHTVDQAMRAGMYHEALTAVQHVRALQRRHPQSATLARVVDEVDDTLERLLTTTVLSQLSGPLVPSNALKIVMFLQSLAHQQQQQEKQQQQQSQHGENGTFSPSSSSSASSGTVSAIASDPTALPELFLELRSEYITGAMREAAALSGGSSFSCLQKILAVYKVHVSEAVSTFKTCFLDSEEPKGGSNHDEQQQLVALDARKGLLCRWATLHANKLLSIFSLHAGQLSGADIAILLDPVLQCSAALSKSGLGAAVEGTLVLRAEQLFLQCLSQASSSFSAALGAHRWRSVVELKSKTAASTLKRSDSALLDTASAKTEVGAEEEDATAASGGGDPEEATRRRQKKLEQQKREDEEREAEEAERQRQQDGFVPPMSLLRFPPLAHAMNSLLAGCNEVRKCALHGLRPVCLRAVCQLVSNISLHLASVRGTLLLEGPELESLRVMARAFEEDFVPHVERCIARVFGTFPTEASDQDFKDTLVKSVKELNDAVQ